MPLGMPFQQYVQCVLILITVAAEVGPDNGTHCDDGAASQQAQRRLSYSPWVSLLTSENWDVAVDAGTCSTASCAAAQGQLTLVDFFAPWCPHCQRYAPIWSQAAEDYRTNQQVTFHAVDCTTEGDLCGRYDVTGYPTTCAFVSHPGGVGRAGCTERNAGSQGYEELLQWIDGIIEREYFYTNAPAVPNASNAVIQPANLVKTFVPQTQASTKDLAAAIFLSLRSNILLPGNQSLVPGSTRALLLSDWLALVQSALAPSSQLARLSTMLRSGERLSNVEWTAQIDQLQLWGHGADVGFYVCKGEQHGLACGLWQLFHSLVAAATDDVSAKGTLNGIRLFVANFFRCVSCQTHFAAVSEQVADAAFTANRSTAMMWLWRVHNNVSVRLAPQWDLNPSQVLYPSALACARCRSSSSNDLSGVVWSLHDVEVFLLQTYTVFHNREGDDESYAWWKWGYVTIVVAIGAALFLVLVLRRRASQLAFDEEGHAHVAVQLQEVSL